MAGFRRWSDHHWFSVMTESVMVDFPCWQHQWWLIVSDDQVINGWRISDDQISDCWCISDGFPKLNSRLYWDFKKANWLSISDEWIRDESLLVIAASVMANYQRWLISGMNRSLMADYQWFQYQWWLVISDDSISNGWLSVMPVIIGSVTGYRWLLDQWQLSICDEWIKVGWLQ